MKTNTQLKISYLYSFLEIHRDYKIVTKYSNYLHLFLSCNQVKHKGKVTPDLGSKEWVFTKKRKRYVTQK